MAQLKLIINLKVNKFNQLQRLPFRALALRQSESKDNDDARMVYMLVGHGWNDQAIVAMKGKVTATTICTKVAMAEHGPIKKLLKCT